MDRLAIEKRAVSTPEIFNEPCSIDTRYLRVVSTDRSIIDLDRAFRVPSNDDRLAREAIVFFDYRIVGR